MTRLFILFMVLLCSDCLLAQRTRRIRPPEVETFETGIIAGINLSQIDGDFFTGFDKVGLYTGLRGVMNLSHWLALQIELLYSEKGSKIEHGYVIQEFSKRDRTIAFGYAEVPILLRFRLDPQQTNPAFLEFGLSVSRRINMTITEDPAQIREGTVYNDIKDEFDNQDMNAILGFSKSFGRLGFGIRYNFGLSKFYINEEYIPPAVFSLRPKQVEFLRNYYLSFFTTYKLLP